MRTKAMLDFFITGMAKKYGMVTVLLTDGEFTGMIRSLREWAAIRIDGKIVAFSIGSIGREEVGFIHFEKADVSYDGLYTAINKLVLENEFPNVRYINREEDLGIPGLRKAKESYFPIAKINKWRLDVE